MSPEIHQVDRDLIRLLGKRIYLLSNSSGSDRQAADADLARRLAEAGVPEFVWQNLVMGCTAAIATSAPPPTQSRPQQVTLIGGNGKMGQFFAQQLCRAGHRVRSLGRKDWGRAEPLLSEADLVLVCVPPDAVVSIVEKAAPYLAPSAVLADITSIKRPVMQAMLDYHTGPVIGLHPMFGPGVRSFLSQTVIVCPGRYPQASQWILDWIESSGGHLTHCTPEEHDQMMVMIQAIRHFWTFSLGVFLAEEGLNIAHSLDFSSPLYRLAIAKVSRLFAQDASLCLEIMLNTETCRQAIARFAETYNHLARLVLQQDVAGLKQAFETTRGVFNQNGSDAMQESNYIIESLMVFLAARAAADNEKTARDTAVTFTETLYNQESFSSKKV